MGSAVTDSEGRFTIDLGADPRSRDALCVARAGRHGEDYLGIADDRGKSLGRPVRITADTREIVLHPPSGAGVEKPTARQWKALANYLTTNRMMLVRDLAEQLARPFPDSPVAEWPVGTRGSALRELAQAFGNESRRIAEGMDLLYRNDFVETTSLATGNVRRAVTYLSDPRRIQGVYTFPDRAFPWLYQSDLSLYRDYLRGVWVAAAQRMYRESTFTTPAVGLLERQLATRFEQDFHTMDDAPRPAAQLLVPLLTTILTRDAARGGLGIPATGIPARGTQTDDEYLQTLIAASKLSPRELRTRFRVSFERRPGEAASPLQLNVEALLGLLADTYQSHEEPFVSPPPIVGQGKPLVFGPYVGRAPFFLQYEEWLERQRGFFPENAYDIRKNLPGFGEDYRKSIVAVGSAKASPGSAHSVVGMRCC